MATTKALVIMQSEKTLLGVFIEAVLCIFQNTQNPFHLRVRKRRQDFQHKAATWTFQILQLSFRSYINKGVAYRTIWSNATSLRKSELCTIIN
mmetsp:Transcript_27609/g.41777  ORF Transcript_27609/g.41777 Transcript_27609/m.41777 type:complete len:93 (+) Transcript_27609:716-994(+)